MTISTVVYAETRPRPVWIFPTILEYTGHCNILTCVLLVSGSFVTSIGKRQLLGAYRSQPELAELPGQNYYQTARRASSCPATKAR